MQNSSLFDKIKAVYQKCAALVRLLNNAFFIKNRYALSNNRCTTSHTQMPSKITTT